MAEEERARKLKIAEEAQREAEEREKVKAEIEKRRKKEKRRRLANQTYKDDYSGLEGSGRLRRGVGHGGPGRKARGRPP